MEDGGQFDRKIAVGTILNYIRQNEDKWLDPGFTGEYGTVTLTNTDKFPFNNSAATVALVNTQPDTHYAVIASVVSENGVSGEIEVTGKLVNGFTISYNGSASSVVVDYIVIGGFTS